MRYILLAIFIQLNIYATLVSAKIVTLDPKNQTATIEIEKIDVGMSGYVVHHITPEHSAILKSCVVKSFDPTTKTATIKMENFTLLRHNALPNGKWEVAVGDTVELAFGYTRSLLVAPSEEIYYQISKAVNTQWVHPDLFATLLSMRGHPTPLQEDFSDLSTASSAGLLFLYLDKKLYTLDIKSFKILHVNDAPLAQDSVKLPFYSRVETIEAAWFGEGSDEMESYEPHYYELLVQNNKTNKTLFEVVKNSKNKEVNSLADQFEIGE
jgi:hypothetical protein